jgi:hypothetical protein
MRKFTNYWTALVLAVGFFAMSCDNNDEIKIDPNAEFDVVLKVKEDSSENAAVEYDVTSSTGTTIAAKVTFETTTASMTRLYITRNIMGMGEELYDVEEDAELDVDLKGDGSVDLEGGDDKFFEYQFNLDVIDTVTNGTVVYSFWTTDGNGDPRDNTKRLAIGPGTITINHGTAVDPDEDEAPVKSFTAKILAAPLADGSSLTFISLVDGEIFAIEDGAEYAAQWDFGYFYTNANHASLASTAAYETAFPFVDVDGIAGTTDLNEAYFGTSAKTSEDFDGVTVAGDLNSITTPANQSISNLEVGDIIEFVDNYGKKGLIRVVQIEGTFESGDFIKIDIKVQP